MMTNMYGKIKVCASICFIIIMFYGQAFIVVNSGREMGPKCHRPGLTNKGNIENAHS